MPLYDFKCKSCGHEFEASKRIAQRDEPQECDKCGKDAERFISGFAIGGGSSPSYGAPPPPPGCGGGG